MDDSVAFRNFEVGPAVKNPWSGAFDRMGERNRFVVTSAPAAIRTSSGPRRDASSKTDPKTDGDT